MRWFFLCFIIRPGLVGTCKYWDKKNTKTVRSRRNGLDFIPLQHYGKKTKCSSIKAKMSMNDLLMPYMPTLKKNLFLWSILTTSKSLRRNYVIFFLNDLLQLNFPSYICRSTHSAFYSYASLIRLKRFKLFTKSGELCDFILWCKYGLINESNKQYQMTLLHWSLLMRIAGSSVNVKSY